MTSNQGNITVEQAALLAADESAVIYIVDKCSSRGGNVSSLIQAFYEGKTAVVKMLIMALLRTHGISYQHVVSSAELDDRPSDSLMSPTTHSDDHVSQRDSNQPTELREEGFDAASSLTAAASASRRPPAETRQSDLQQQRQANSQQRSSPSSQTAAAVSSGPSASSKRGGKRTRQETFPATSDAADQEPKKKKSKLIRSAFGFSSSSTDTSAYWKSRQSIISSKGKKCIIEVVRERQDQGNCLLDLAAEAICRHNLMRQVRELVNRDASSRQEINVIKEKLLDEAPRICSRWVTTTKNNIKQLINILFNLSDPSRHPVEQVTEALDESMDAEASAASSSTPGLRQSRHSKSADYWKSKPVPRKQESAVNKGQFNLVSLYESAWHNLVSGDEQHRWHQACDEALLHYTELKVSVNILSHGKSKRKKKKKQVTRNPRTSRSGDEDREDDGSEESDVGDGLFGAGDIGSIDGSSDD